MSEMLKKNQKTLADKIAGILSAAPAQFDPDEDNLDDTSAKLTDFDNFAEENDNDEVLLGTFRKKNVDLLADVDARYAGKSGSRKSLKPESSDEESNNEGGPVSDEESLGVSDEASTEESETAEDEGSEEQLLPLSDTDDANFQHVGEVNVSEQVKKGLCVRNQMNIWESLLEVRIQMQKCLVAANKLPQKKHFNGISKNDKSGDFKRKTQETTKILGGVLDRLLLLQKLVIRKYPETKSLHKKQTESITKNSGSDEEIPSDTDDESELREEEIKEVEKPQTNKKRKLGDYENDISDLHTKYKCYRNDTIEKWNTKTRLSVTKNSGQTHSVVSQIEHLLSDKEKLRKRTQLKRSEYKILCQDAIQDEGLQSSEDNGDIQQVEEYNNEIFDDSDFYHQLLRELIEVKSADVTDPVQLSKQWIKLHNLRSKMKRKIDTRATKGRKIRYAVHTKLVNFMAPLDKQLWTEEAKNELYGSLFGKMDSKRM